MDCQPTQQLHQGHLDWAWLLAPAQGGPGESPGRAEAVERAKQRSANRAAVRIKPKKSKR